MCLAGANGCEWSSVQSSSRKFHGEEGLLGATKVKNERFFLKDINVMGVVTQWNVGK